MAKTKAKPSKAPARGSAPAASLELPDFLKQRQHAIFLSLLALLIVVFFHEAFFSGKVFNVPDNAASSQIEQGYLEQAKSDGINAFWNPYIFCGMPTWGSSLPGHGMYIHTFLDPLKPMFLLQVYGIAQSIVGVLPLPPSFWDFFNYFLLGLFTYLFALRRKLEPVVAFLVAISAVFTLYSLNWVMAGHNTKITVFAWLPALLLLVDRLFEKKSILNIALLVAAFHLTFNAGHVQMVLYNLIAVGLYVCYKWYDGAKVTNVLAVGAIAVATAAFAFLMLSGPYFAAWEYKNFSIRGAGSGGSGHGPATGGLDYAYATLWSFSIPEIMTFFVPSFSGFGTPTYWGTMQFTESPIYLGAVMCSLALIALLLRPKDRFLHFWAFLGLLAVLISLGGNFGLVYDFFFYHVPLFNNFRIPSMILYLMALCVAFPAGVGVSELIARTKEKKKAGPPDPAITRAIWIPAAAALLLLLGLSAMQGAYKDAVAENMQEYQKQSWSALQQVEQAVAQGQASQVPEQYRSLTRDHIFKEAQSDAVATFVKVALAALLLWFFASRRVPLVVTAAGLAALVLFDLWTIDYKPMKMEDRSAKEASVARGDVEEFLLRDPGYRVLPLNEHSGDNFYAGFGIQSVTGYSPAKMKIYDDIRNSIFKEFGITSTTDLDSVRWRLLSFMNTKYILGPSGQALPWPNLKLAFSGRKEDVYENTAVLPKAFFVGAHILPGHDSLQFKAIQSPDYAPDRIAYLATAPAKPLPVLSDAQLAAAHAQVTGRGINSMDLRVETPADALLKVSEIYYPSGWTATIDGAETDILRTDYAFRAIVVPAGKHTVRFSFEPKSYTAGLIVTTITNYLLAAVLIVYLVLWARKRFSAKAPAQRKP